MKLLVIQHVDFEGPAAIKQWAKANKHSIIHHYAATSTVYPAQSAFDWLIIMGGPMGVNDQLPWMGAEIEFVRQTMSHNKTILGICLGAQIIAAAEGADIKKNPQREIGWYPVTGTATFSDHWLAQALPNTFVPLHWHGDTFALPAGAEHLLESSACSNQAFCLRDKIIGLQFHLEFDSQTTSRVAEACADELAGGGDYIQSQETILAAEQRFEEANNLMFDLLDAMSARK